ncbi:cyclopropane-fatty-acyl-phospholipid synthase family protein [Nocardioides sp. WL0053]|uniref:Cyclopropane-fatty-acyl-phospholipid synthase family protein n=1 Tax=Nocardioides jiangsuensis TaxID=2866161 RepID=A0ABS7RH70_9ACTN|nr:cyclopropane-fatty-acyl-phospholipid synthase family protein [Nocardioides jiangsuensis]MBY9073857.1 cyclopropane-fatty-acyl-phospholipid synthase family protein [Nocardioides jiangsuensis]
MSTTIDGPGQESLAAAQESLATGENTAARSLPPAPAYGLRARVAKQVLARILRNVPVTARLSTGEVYGGGEVTLEVTDPTAFFARLGQSPMIGIGESYMAGEWRPSADTDLADALAPFAERLNELIRPVFYRMRHVVLPRGLNPENSRHGARKNIEAHYDLSNEMFAQFLDPTMSYSSALFASLVPAPTQDELEQAQLRKVDAILDAAGVTAGSRVLEIGTGWGTLAIRAAQRGARVTTITISTEQAALAQQRVDAAGVSDRVEIALRDYRDQTGQFDAVVSVEMIEAVGEKYWPTYFRSIDGLLAPGGKVAIQAILLEHHRMVATRDTYTWIHKYIFPGGLLPSQTAIEQVLAEHTTLGVSDVAPLGQHYAHTLRLWRERFLANWPTVRDLGFDGTFRRMWEFYLAYCEAGFRTGYLEVAQITMERPAPGAR